MVQKGLTSITLSMCAVSIVLAVFNVLFFCVVLFTGAFSHLPFLYYVLATTIFIGVGIAIASLIFAVLAVWQKAPHFPLALISLALSSISVIAYFALILLYCFYA